MTLRNAIHEVMTDAYGRDDWYDCERFEAEERNKIESAKRRFVDDGHQVIASRVIAELMFGFWTALAGKASAQTLWDKHLFKAFREHRGWTKKRCKAVKKIRFLRNRVAHHESIIGKLGGLQHHSYWIIATNSFDMHHAARPKKPIELPLEPTSDSQSPGYADFQTAPLPDLRVD